MKLPTKRIPEPFRSAIRFSIVGSGGTFIQYVLYWGFLQLFNYLWPNIMLANTAFTLAYILEIIINYVLTSYYTFGSRPKLKNLGGFAIGKTSGYIIQIGLLNGLLYCSLEEEAAGLIAMLIAGVVNFFIIRIFFGKGKKREDKKNKEEEVDDFFDEQL